MKNWKTTLAGLLGTIGAALIVVDDPTVKAIGAFMVALSPVLLGLAAKDSNVHGGTVVQATPSKVQAETLAEGKVLDCKQDAAKCETKS